MEISIITPSYNMLPYLKCASASVQDQSEKDVEHIVVDGNSTDGTLAWLDSNKKVLSNHGKDEGMYDAINKGLKMARGNILAYLNCDEQYLPGTLSFVRDYFTKNPDVDIIFGDALLTRPDGSLIAFRKGYQPRWYYILSSHLYVLSCTMFFRRGIIEDGFLFNSKYRAVADADYVVRLLRHGYKARHIKMYFSTFTMTGDNLSNDNLSKEEHRNLFLGAPFYIRAGKPVLNMLRFVEKFCSGAYHQKKPLKYSVYTPGNLDKRNNNSVMKASFRWRFS